MAGTNKVIYGNQTIMDISDSTTEASNLLQGEVGYSGNGDRVVGTYVDKDENVKQVPTTENKNFRVLLSETNDNAEHTEGAKKNSDLYYNPSTGRFRVKRLVIENNDTNANVYPLGIDATGRPPISNAGEVAYPMFVTYKTLASDGTTEVTRTVYPIGVLGNSASDSNNNGVVLGSQNGMTLVGAGESSKTYAQNALGGTNNENLYLTADGNVYLVSTIANDSSSVAMESMLNTTGFRVVAKDGVKGTARSALLILGNNTDKDAGDGETGSLNGNSYGALYIYGKSTHYSRILVSDNISADRTTTLPDKSGEITIVQTLTNQDLNDIRTSGFYEAESGNSCANKPTVSPVIQQFGMVVVRSALSNTNYCTQILFAPSTGVIWKRSDKNGTWDSWSEVKITDENVKQIQTGVDANQYRLLLTTTDDNAEETNTVRKCSGVTYQPSNGALRLNRQHTSTSNQQQQIIIGNNIPTGTAGNVTGQFSLYGRNAYYGRFWDRFDALTASRQYELPNQDGMLALRDNITRAKLNSNWNLLSTPYYTTDGTSNGITRKTNGNGSITFTGTATGQHTFYVRRYSDEWTLPAGKYRLSGCPSGGSSTTYRLRVGADTSTSTTTWLGYDTGDGFEFTLTEEKIITVTFNIYSDYAISGSLTFTPTLVRLDGGWVKIGNTSQISTIDARVFNELRFIFNVLNTQNLGKYQIMIPVLTCTIPVPQMPNTTFSGTGGMNGEITVHFDANKAGPTITISNIGLNADNSSNYTFTCDIYGKA